MCNRARRWRAAVAPLVFTAANTTAANWTVVPEISVRETYTDNVFLSEPLTHDFITQVTPGIRIDGRGPRLAATLSYRPSALFYARQSDFNDVVNDLSAFGRLEAIERLFFVEAAASITQSFITPFAPQPGEVFTITRNRFESRTASVSPYLRGQLGGSVDYELRSRHLWTHTDTAALSDFYTRQWFGRLAGPVRRFGWAVEFDDTVTAYEGFTQQPDQASRLYRGRLFFQPDPGWRFFVSGGREANNFVLQEWRRETIYGAGLYWRPGPRTSADVEFEHRFFGPYRLARFNHRDRLTAWSASYSRDTSNFQTEVLRLPPGNTASLLDAVFAARIPDPNERRAAVDQFVRATGAPDSLAASRAFYTERIYLREGVDASFAILGVRNSVTFTAFYTENTELFPDVALIFPDPFVLGDRFTQQGFGARADHRLTPFATLGASVTRTYTRREELAGRDARDDYVTVTLTHSVSPNTTTFAGVSITRFESEEAGLANPDANSVFIGLTHRF